MRKIAIAVLALVGVACVFGGLLYMTRTEFTHYHAAVSGKQWAQLEPGLQTIIVGMLRILGGGFLACGLAVLWLVAYPLRQGARWAPWAILSVNAAVMLPTLSTTLMLQAANPEAGAPVVPAAIMLLVAAVGAVVALAQPAPANTASSAAT